ncbi:intradiol ring-cleavage dioxygenase [Kribbella flavida DSM 17836]|uniref:Intradiol ring-cleavage dioxygenase n=1 Tax=Kribbella flavida (strain DSM 17836 / JCM 10339 / NBRC 14399) TaxID=479435 RepID=D2Q4G2_KRIFD|nr:intradiol ring-cleavage dioxygenase [Kribbella flavida]ADB32276.1 intradiol ring-cleavage dioxygenase [Kribbella flavida DSM 17836]
MTPPHEHDLGLVHDLGTLRRRNVLRLLAGAGLAAVAGCATDDTPSSTPSATTGTPTQSPGSTASAGCVEKISEETAGPFPGDGTNGPNVLTESGIVRSDLTRSFGSASGVAEGVPLTVELVVQDATKCSPLQGAAVYVWHCDAQGRYSLYSEGAENENYLRGVQAADANGKVTFTTVFPAAYQGRWPHLHFEVYASLSEATAAGKISATSQLALPTDACEAVYATSGYDGSARNLSGTSLRDDNVFGEDEGVSQLATVTGSVQDGYRARLTVGV